MLMDHPLKFKKDPYFRFFFAFAIISEITNNKYV